MSVLLPSGKYSRYILLTGEMSTHISAYQDLLGWLAAVGANG